MSLRSPRIGWWMPDGRIPGTTSTAISSITYPRATFLPLAPRTGSTPNRIDPQSPTRSFALAAASAPRSSAAASCDKPDLQFLSNETGKPTPCRRGPRPGREGRAALFFSTDVS
jgi:hypothetical protein